MSARPLPVSDALISVCRARRAVLRQLEAYTPADGEIPCWDDAEAALRQRLAEINASIVEAVADAVLGGCDQ